MTSNRQDERELIEKLYSYFLYRRYLNPSLIDFIDQIQSYEYIPEITRVADDMGIHASTVWKFMNLLKSKGLRFLGVVEISKLNAEVITIILNEYVPYEKLFKSLMREYAPVLPWGTAITYIIPRGTAETFLNELLPALPREPKEVIKSTHSIIGRPNLKRYYDVKSREIVINWEDLANMIRAAPRESIPREVQRRGRIDDIDLFILRKLEINPFESLRKVTEELNKEMKPVTPVNYIRVLRHFKNHIEARGVLKGVRLDTMPLYPYDTVYVKTIIKGNPAEIHRVTKVLTTHPMFPEAFLNPSEGVSVINAFIPLTRLFSYSKFLDSLRDEGLLKEWSVTYLDRGGWRKFALPITLFSKPVNMLVREGSGEFVEEIDVSPSMPPLNKLKRMKKS